ncbi:MAG TPA: FAD-dependent oxidoreductase [Trueperaceae bacterium]
MTLPPREARIAAEVDVLVVGGGPAGLGAALGAAWAGAEVVLVERYGFLGGNATAALVMPLMSHFTQSQPSANLDLTRLLPADHGPGDPVVAGALEVLLHRLISNGWGLAPSEETGYTVPFDPEGYKQVLLELLDEAGVRYLFHSFASGVVAGEDGPTGVTFEGKSGPLVIYADSIVDCTGDGDVAAASGAEYRVGRELDGLVQPMTLMFRMVEFERPEFAAYVRENPQQWRGVHGLWALIEEAHAAGDLDLPRDDILLFATPHERELSVNSTRVGGVLGSDVWDLTRAEWQSRRQMRQIEAFLRKYVPGFQTAYLAQSGVQIGVRETRRIVGDYVLTGEDVVSARQFDDVVARGAYPIDIHDPSGKGTVLKRLPPGEAYDIPLRCLLPRGVDRLLVAGRCISGTHEAHSSYRVTPIAVATGQAAGVCAALASARGEKTRHVPVADVQSVLLAQGANLRDLSAQESTGRREPERSSRRG